MAAPEVLRFVEPAALSTVRLDLRAGSGASSGFVLDQDFDLGSIETRPEYLESPPFPGAIQISRHHGLVPMQFRLRAKHTTIDDLVSLVQSLHTELDRFGVMEWKPDSASPSRYIDYVPSSLPQLFRGQHLAMRKIATLLDDIDGLPVTVWRQPYLYGPLLTSDTNILANATLHRDVNNDGTPNGWAWDSVGSISAQAISDAVRAYSFTIATTDTRNLQQTTPAASVGNSQGWSLSFYIKAAAAGVVRVRAVYQPLTSGGLANGAEIVSSQVAVTTGWQRITVSGTTPAASTDKARIDIRFENAAATATVVYLRDVQFERAAAASTFVAGTETVPNDPASGMGRVVYVVNPGNAPTPARVDLTMDTGSKVVQARIARRAVGNLGALANQQWFGQAESATLANQTASAADANASGGNVARTDFDTPSALDYLLERWQVTVTPFEPGTYRVFARVKGAAGKKYRLQLRWAAANVSVPMASNEEVVYDLTAVASSHYTVVDLGTVTVPAGVSAATYLRLFFYAACDTSPSGDLDWDFWCAVPAGNSQALFGDQLVVVSTRGWRDSEGDAVTVWKGKDLVTATSPATSQPGTVNGESIDLDHNATNPERVGTPPAAGFALAEGRHTVQVDATLLHDPSAADETIGALKIRDVTDGDYLDAGGQTMSKDLVIKAKQRSRRKRPFWAIKSFDSETADVYQFQVEFNNALGSGSNRKVRVHRIKHTFQRYLQNLHTIILSGETNLASRLEVPLGYISILGVFVEPLHVAGGFIDLDPGLNVLFVEFGDICNIGYEEADAREPLPKDLITRTPTVGLRFYPRYTG